MVEIPPRDAVHDESDRRVGTKQRLDRGGYGGQRRGFDGDEHGVLLAEVCRIGRGSDGGMMLAVHRLNGRAVSLDRGQMGATGDDGHLGSGAVQAGGEVAADGAGPVDADLHNGPSLVAVSDARSGGRVKAACSGRPQALGLEGCDPFQPGAVA
jgi:hypothetical protein